MKEKLHKLGKKKIVIICSAVLFVCLLIGLSYAWLSQTITGTKNMTITVGDLDLVLDESTSNGIQLKYAIPTTDEDGKAFDPYTFKVENNGKVAVNYSLSLVIDEEDLASCQQEEMVSCEQLDLNDIRYEIKDNNGASQVGTLGESGFLIDGYLGPDEESSYELRIWLDISTGNDAQGKVFYGQLKLEAKQTEILQTVSDTLLAGVGDNGAINTTDPDQTFITGTDPNNYIWYSGKLWRAVSIDPSDNSVKLVTQWNISAIPYNASGNSAFEGSYIEEWLNDTSVDGFLGNLRDYENFIKTDSVWNATLDAAALGSITKPTETTMVTNAVGLLNIYEYQMSYSGTDYSNGYLNNGLYWWTLTPYNSSRVRNVYNYGNVVYDSPSNASGVRPSINLKSSVKIVSGDGSENDPYRLAGDNDSNLNGTQLNTRYSGEYIKFGAGENTLYRIVSHETSDLTKITSAEPLKDSGSFIASAFGNNAVFLNSNTIGTFLNGEYLTRYVGSNYSEMIEPSTIWYLGTVGDGASYRLAKYSSATGNDLTSNTTTVQIGLLRLGELMSGQFDRYDNNTIYWTITPYSTSNVRSGYYNGNVSSDSPSTARGVRPAMNLKSNVVITGGNGTKSDPFQIALS